MSDLRSLIRLKEKELRCLEWGLMAQRAHEGLGEELEDREAEQQFAGMITSRGICLRSRHVSTNLARCKAKSHEAVRDLDLIPQAVWICLTHELLLQAAGRERTTLRCRKHHKGATNPMCPSKVERRLARERREATEDHEAIPSTSSGTSPTKKLRSRSGLPVAGSGPVLPALCIICQKKEKFVNRAGKRQRDTLSKAETLTAGQLQKAAELKEDQSILLHIKDKDCVALEVQYHKGCYNQYTRFLTRPEKPEKDQEESTRPFAMEASTSKPSSPEEQLSSTGGYRKVTVWWLSMGIVWREPLTTKRWKRSEKRGRRCTCCWRRVTRLQTASKRPTRLSAVGPLQPATKTRARIKSRWRSRKAQYSFITRVFPG
ncbi:uncharacterized protein LOC130205646 [Pseudoliparis swirei]|uniref:uncharacterized protein LOC130205646 n=1 Tax=Pseudoliparis swirei TaxID=2059687 RepID=UPI0024BE7248|nr:uncharacterized protein LOC130205646 [Pseudoliparis swirei]